MHLTKVYQRWRERRAYDWWRREWYLTTGDDSFLTLTEKEIDVRLTWLFVTLEHVGTKAEQAAQALAELAEVAIVMPRRVHNEKGNR